MRPQYHPGDHVMIGDQEAVILEYEKLEGAYRIHVPSVGEVLWIMQEDLDYIDT